MGMDIKTVQRPVTKEGAILITRLWEPAGVERGQDEGSGVWERYCPLEKVIAHPCLKLSFSLNWTL
jgi:hypothetical protein